MTKRQLFSSVRKGQLITFHVFDVEPITGYLAGEDDECYFVLQPVHNAGFKRQLIRKVTNPLMDLHDTETFKNEEFYEDMEAIVRHFRIWLVNNVRAHIPPPSEERRSYYDQKAS